MIMKKTVVVILCLCLFLSSLPTYAETMGEKNALESAKMYLDIMNFSYEGLIDMLESVGFTKEQAEYGAAIAYNESAQKPAGTKASSSTAPTTASKKNLHPRYSQQALLLIISLVNG